MISFPYTSVKTYLTDGTPQYDRAISSDIKRAFNKLRYKQGIAPDSGGAFRVTAGDGMNVNVDCAGAWCLVGGDFGNEIVKTRTLSREAANATYDRIDRIILRNDLSQDARKIDLYVLTGTPSAYPTAPAPTNTPTVQEIVLADVFTPKGISTTSNERITDQRLNPTLCGVLSNAFGDTDTKAFFAQITALIARLTAEITAIEQGSAVMLKNVFVGKTADSVKKADTALACTGNAATATTATTCTGNAATVGDNSTLASVGAITTTPFLAAWEGKTVRCIAPTDVEVGAARKVMGNKDRNSIYMNWGSPISGAVNFTVDSSGNLPVAKAQSCTGHAALDAYAPQEAAFIRESAETKTSFFSYPNGCDQNNCLVLAVFSNEVQFYGSRHISAQSIGVVWRDVPSPDYPNFKPTKVIVQRYK